MIHEADCSPFAFPVEQSGGISLTDFHEFTTPWMDATDQSKSSVLASFLSEQNYEYMCQLWRPVDETLLQERRSSSTYPDWTSVKCSEPDCDRFQVRYCCRAKRKIEFEGELLNPIWSSQVVNPRCSSAPESETSPPIVFAALDGQPDPAMLSEQSFQQACNRNEQISTDLTGRLSR